MAVIGSRVNVTDTATAIATADADGISVGIRNTDASASIDLGGSDVESAAGFELEAGEFVSVDLVAGETLYGVTASGTVSVHVLRSRVTA